jgi:hypothetical protein
VRAGVVDREHLAVIGVEDGDWRVRVDAPRLTAGEGREWTDFKHDRDLLGVVDLYRIVKQSS